MTADAYRLGPRRGAAPLVLSLASILWNHTTFADNQPAALWAAETRGLHLAKRGILSAGHCDYYHRDVRLTDYKVRVLDSRRGSAAKVRVLIEWTDHRRSWTTVGVSDNIIEASWRAMTDAIRLELMRLTEKDDSLERAVEDYCWGV